MYEKHTGHMVVAQHMKKKENKRTPVDKIEWYPWIPWLWCV